MFAPGLGTLLRHLLARLDGDVQAIYDELGIPFRPRFFPVARELQRRGPTSVGTLARAVGLTQPAITQTLEEMRKAELVAQLPGRDRRERLAELTERGREVTNSLAEVWAAVDAAAADLDAELPIPLALVVCKAHAALEREPFGDRIKRKMKA